MGEASAQAQPNSAAGVPRLRRVLTLWDLIFYGIVLTQPIAPIPLFGVAQSLSRGHCVTTILIAMLPMLITAVSYGRMAALYPAAGSAYTYVGRGLNPHLGFFAGWAMFLGYLLQPLINTIWIATALHARYLPEVPYAVAAALVAGIITLLNIQGVRTSARTNKILLVSMCLVVGVFLILGVFYLWRLDRWQGLFSVEPFYDPRTFHFPTIWGATSFAALTYIGFDGVTTLAEEVQNPKRNVLLAAVVTCAFTGIVGGLEVYLGQRIWPDFRTFPNLETAFMDVCRRVGGSPLFHAMGMILIVAAFGSGLTGGLGAARLLFGMGRDNVLPRKLFAHLSPRTNTPDYNVVLIGVLSFTGAVVLNLYGHAYQYAGELLNFGAFVTFMGVNLATFWEFTFATPPGHQRRTFVDTILPLVGVVFCATICWSLSGLVKTIGGIWLALGLVYSGVKTRGFRTRPVMLDFGEA